MNTACRILVSCVLAGALVPGQAHANATVIVALPGAAVQDHPAPWGFPIAGTLAGTPMTFVNLDALAGHNVTAKNAYGSTEQPWCDRFEEGLCPLFWSETVTGGTSTPILGTELLAPTSFYEFQCTIHPGWMTGQILSY